MLFVMAVMVVAAAAIVVAVPAFLVFPATVALRAVCLAGTILASAVLAAAFSPVFLFLFLALRGVCRERQRAQ